MDCLYVELCDYHFCSKGKCYYGERERMKDKLSPEPKRDIVTQPKFRKRGEKKTSAKKKSIKRPNISKRALALVRSGHPKMCACCGSKRLLTFDHIIPLGKDGEDTNENGQILCLLCNGLKSDRLMSLTQLQMEFNQKKKRR